MIGNRRFVRGLRRFQIFRGVGALADHDYPAIDLDLGVLNDGLGLHDVRLAAASEECRRLDAGQRLLHHGLALATAARAASRFACA